MYGMDAEGLGTFCNPAAARLLGYADASEVLGKNVHRLFHHTRPDGSPYPENECPVFRSSHTGEDVHTQDEFYWRKDGSTFPVELSSRQIRRDGKLIGALVSFLDITERKRREMEVHQSQKLEAVGRLASGIDTLLNSELRPSPSFC